jgi:hypothetical protein
MIRNKKLTRIIAIFFVLEMFADIALPYAAFALTSGPTAPETSSFEPVDTTDMVNLMTGDFVYNLPLLEVPGPSGGYPLSLSYHAGIKPNQEASWVGLGWTLNPGAINRMVNGYPDDHTGAIRTTRDYWAGGSTSAYSTGVGVAGINVGATIATDTYRGVGVGFDAGFGYGIGPASIGVSASTGPYGGTSAGVRVGVNYGPASAGISAGTDGVSAYGQIGNSNLGISMSSNSTKPQLSAGGFSANVSNSKAGDISTRSNGFQIVIPIYYLNFSFGYRYQRYYSDETADFLSNGILYVPSLASADSYALHDPQDFLADIEKSNPNKEPGGAFPSYDSYTVLGQGIGGTMSPYFFENRTTKRSKHISDIISYKDRFFIHKKGGFRFHNDFSNSLTFNDPSIDFLDVNQWLGQNLSYTNAEPQYLTEGFDESSGQLAGSKHVDWYTVNEIVTGVAEASGLMLHERTAIQENKTFVYLNKDGDKVSESFDISGQIGAYKVVNSSGVTYHYSQPVYTYAEYTEINNYEDNTWRREINPHPYAYTWLLTAVTGPDYKDRNSNGIPDKGDWGYWVGFNYGKWANEYVWRNPALGESIDINQKWHQFSTGKKELYYLNSIKTASHTAVFEKKWRSDGKSLVDYSRLPSVSFEGYSLPLCGNVLPISPLRLDKIYLFTNEDYEELGGDDISGQFIDNGECIPSKTSEWNVIDFNDTNELFNAKAIRVVQMDYSYDLQPNTSNSYFPFGEDPDIPGSFEPIIVPKLNGKLTLDKLRFLGKSGADIVPPINLSYKVENKKITNSSLLAQGSDSKLLYNESDLNTGDIIQFNVNGSAYYYFVQERLIDSGTISYNVDPLYGNALVDGSYNINWERTKNPPFNKDAFDIWGYYKVDYDENIDSENIRRMVSPISSKNVDAWSLNQIETSLGAKIKIDYESDHYSNSVLQLENSLTIKEVVVVNTEDTKITFHENLDLTKILTVNQDIRLLLFLLSGSEGTSKCARDGQWLSYNIYLENVDKNLNIDKVDMNSITIKNLELSSLLSSGKGVIPMYCPSNELGQSLDINYNFIRPPTVYAGNLMFDGNEIGFGGGTRVKMISLDDSKNLSRTEYSYTNGITSYEPLGLNKVEFKPYNSPYTNFDIRYKKQQYLYKELFYDVFSELLINSRELPPPGVMYGDVNITTYVNNIKTPVRTAYEFEIFEKDQVQVDRYDAYSEPNHNFAGDPGAYFPTPNVNVDIEKRTIRFRNFTSKIGNLRRKTLFDNNNNPVISQNNKYLHDSKTNDEYRLLLKNNYKNQGVVQQLFNEYRIIFDLNLHMALLSLREEYPSILISQENTNYKTGITTTSKNLEFDFFSGAVTKTLAQDSYGNYSVNETTPAYRKYSAMGLSLNGGANMLTQVAENKSYKVASTLDLTPVGLMNASVQTWSDQTSVLEATVAEQQGIWRKHRSYSFLGNDVDISAEPDGLYPYTSFTEFDTWFHGGEPTSAQWQKNSEITLFDVYSHALEAKDVNGNYAATKMDGKQEQVYATAANANYDEFAYSGAEDELINGTWGGDVKNSIGTVRTKTNGYPTHTGEKSVHTSFSGSSFVFTSDRFVSGRTYRASVWATTPTVNIKYGVLGGGVYTIISNSTKQAGSWYLHNVDINYTAGTSTFSIWCAGNNVDTYWDDFRVHPIDAAMTSYVYNEWGELSHILDANNLYTEYVYDGMGRLKETHRESFEYGKTKVTQNEIVYARNDPGYAGYYSFETTLTKNNANSFTSAVTLGTPPYTYTWYKDNVQVRQVTNSISTDSYSTTSDCAFPIRCDVTDNRSRTRSMNGTGGVEWIASKNAWPTTGANTGNSFNVSVNSNCGDITYAWNVSAAYGFEYLPGIVGTSSGLNYTFPECGEYKVKCVVREGTRRVQILEGLMIVNSVGGTACAL